MFLRGDVRDAKLLNRGGFYIICFLNCNIRSPCLSHASNNLLILLPVPVGIRTHIEPLILVKVYVLLFESFEILFAYPNVKRPI